MANSLFGLKSLGDSEGVRELVMAQISAVADDVAMWMGKLGVSDRELSETRTAETRTA